MTPIPSLLGLQTLPAHPKLRREPGSKGEGAYYHVIVRPKWRFVRFQTSDPGRPGHLLRVAGKQKNGRWLTHKWLVSKTDAHVANDHLVIDDPKTAEVLFSLSGPIIHKKGDLFLAASRPNIPEREKPTPAQRKAWSKNIKKAQEALRLRREMMKYGPFPFFW